MNAQPAILSTHSLFDGFVRLTRFRTRFGATTWFLDEVDAEGNLGDSIFQGTRGGAVDKVRELAATWHG